MAAGVTITGTSGNDVLNGTEGNDKIYGLAGDDILQGGAGADQLFGGEGIDTAYYYASSQAVTINLKTGLHTGDAAGDKFTAIEKFHGTEYDDTFVSGADATSFDGTWGFDTIDYSTSGVGVSVDLRNGVGTGGDAEGDTYSGIDRVIGSAYSDTLTSSIFGCTLQGGAGNDIYILTSNDDTIVEVAGEGTDEVRTALDSLNLAAQVENLRYTGTANFTAVGNDLANVITGGAADDKLEGGAGNDTLNGESGEDVLLGGLGNDTLNGAVGNDTLDGEAGNDLINGGLGNDTMVGGLGNDIYVVDAVGDSVTEIAGEGTDEVRTTLTSYTLGSEIENLRYTGTAAFTGVGNALANTITGAGGIDTLTGGAGNDILNGVGGNDKMTGGTGNDIYFVDSTGDTVTEVAGEGIDEVRTTLSSYSLGTELEILRYTGTAAFVGNGNALDNTLYGGVGDDNLNGGVGNDVLRGGDGDDTYRVNTSGDQVFEADGQGFDTVVSDNSFTLAAGQEIEVLRLTPTNVGRGLAGNEFDNTIVGNAGDNGLTGGGGNDTIDGGDGGADRIDGGAGTDTVSHASTTTRFVSINLDEGVTWDGRVTDSLISIENAIGSTFNDTLKGSTGNNTLNGGEGSDTLIGYGGSDTFAFKAALGSANIDRITDFASGDDRIMLDKTYMGALTAGTLAAGAFKNVGQSLDADDRILYDKTTGDLFYDADGSGSTAAVRFAILDNKSALTNQDILVV